MQGRLLWGSLKTVPELIYVWLSNIVFVVEAHTMAAMNPFNRGMPAQMQVGSTVFSLAPSALRYSQSFVLVFPACQCLCADVLCMPQMSEPAVKLVSGVGLVFNQEDINGPISVSCISKGGSAEQQGKVQVGDEIDSVENINVAGKSIAELKQLMRGEIGSYVNMKLRRGEQDGSSMHYDVSLMRGQAEAFLSREMQRLQSLLDKDRQQLNHAQVGVDFSKPPALCLPHPGTSNWRTLILGKSLL